MTSYLWSNLSPHDFERVCGSLFSVIDNVRYERFSPGPDQGIDLRHALGEGHGTIIQCKHYLSVTGSVLKARLKPEIPKVLALSPERYIVASSASLSPQNKVDIVDMFEGRIQGTGDVWGIEDLDAELDNYPEVARAHPKLWLASTTVLDRIVNSKHYWHSEYTVERLNRQVQLYVENPSLGKSMEISNEHHVCIIAGAAGVGKTMLADMLALSHVRDGWELIAVSNDIDEAMSMWKEDAKQLFLYDDFLGRTARAELFGKNEDSRLLGIIDQIHSRSNKRLVMTTRDYILAAAQNQYERIDKAKLDPALVVVDVGEYSRLVRARILYNHLFFGGVSLDQIADVASDMKWKLIVDHKMYNPRVIERTIESAAGGQDNFAELFVESFDDPGSIWTRIYEHDLSPAAKFLLQTLLSLPNTTRMEDVEAAFRDLSDDSNGDTPLSFTEGLREVEPTFVRFTKNRNIEFSNPSVRDWMLSYVSSRPQTLMRIVSRARFFQQVELLVRYSESTDESGENIASSLKRILRRNAAETIQALCELFPNNLPAGHADYGVRDLRTAEVRLAFCIERSISLDRVLDADWTEQSLDAVLADWISGSGSKSAIVQLIRLLIDRKTQLSSTRVNEAKTAAVAFMLDQCDWPEDYLPLVELANLETDYPSPEELETICDRVVDQSRSWADWDADTPEELEEMAESTEIVASAFQLDLRSASNEMLGRASQMEDEREEHDDEDYDSYRDALREAAEETNEEDEVIQEIFESLVEETER